MNNYPPDTRIRILLDFLTKLILWLIGINLGALLLYVVVQLILNLLSQWTNSSMDTAIVMIESLWPTIQRILGGASIVFALVITIFQTRNSFLMLNLPQKTISSQDVVDQNGVDPASRERIRLIVSSLVRITVLIVVAIILYNLLTAFITRG